MPTIPTVSVLTCVLNGERWIAETVESILGQTFGDFEYIIVDDGSTDATPRILAGFAERDDRLIILANEKNRGIIYSNNRGVEAARGELIARTDADDISLPRRFERQVEYMRAHPDVACASSIIRMIDEQGLHAGFWDDDLNTVDPESIRRMLPSKNCIANSTSMARGDILKRFAYDTRLKINEDYDIWMRMAAEGLKLDKIAEVLVHYRVSALSFSDVYIRNKPARNDMVYKWLFLRGELAKKRFNSFDRQVAVSMLRSAHIWFYQGFKPYQSLRRIPPYIRENLAMKSGTIQTAAGRPTSNKPGLMLIIPSLGMGGAERVMQHVARGLESDYDLHVVAMRGGDARWGEQFKPYCVSLTHPPAGVVLHARRSVCAYLDKIAEGKSIRGAVVTNAILAYFWLQELNRRGRRMPAIDIQHTVGAETHQPALLWAAPLLDRRVCISQLLVEHLRAIYGEHGIASESANLRLVRNGIDLETFKRETAEKLPAPAGIETGDDKLVLWAGRFSKEKDPLLFLELAAEFRRRGGSGVKFVMAGDGPLHDLAHRAAAQMNVADSVVFAGFLNDDEMRALMARAWLLAMTSEYEGVPLAALEALAMGVPVLSTAVGAVGEAIENGRTGVLLPAKTGFPAAASDKILHLLRNPDKHRKMIDAGRVSLAGKFDIDSMVAGYRAVIGELFGK